MFVPLAYVRNLALCCALAMPLGAQAATVLYTQDFENPNNPPGFSDTTGRDVSQQTVNELYGGQPAGFSFLQTNTVETLEINGTFAFGAGYSDPSGQGGNYALGLLSTVQNDLLGLTFNVGAFDFLNIGMIVSSIDLDGVGGPFGAEGQVPQFRFTLRDGADLNGTVLDTEDAFGTASPRNVFDWTAVTVGLSTAGNDNGTVTLVIDLIVGGYAAMDNFRIVASDTDGDLAIPTPEPATLALLGAGLLGLACRRRATAQRR